MTYCARAEQDLKSGNVRVIAIYEDGSTDVFAVAQSTLDQGPAPQTIARMVAWEWQRDGYLSRGEIIGVRPEQFALN